MPPQSRITLTRPPQGHPPFQMQMDGKHLVIEFPDTGTPFCRICDGQEPEQRVPLELGTTTVWSKGVEHHIDVVVASDGAMEILGYQPAAAQNRAFAAVHTQGGGTPFKPGLGGFSPGFPFKRPKF